MYKSIQLYITKYFPNNDMQLIPGKNKTFSRTLSYFCLFFTNILYLVLLCCCEFVVCKLCFPQQNQGRMPGGGEKPGWNKIMRRHEETWDIRKHEQSWGDMGRHETLGNMSNHEETLGDIRRHKETWGVLRRHEETWDIRRHEERWEVIGESWGEIRSPQETKTWGDILIRHDQQPKECTSQAVWHTNHELHVDFIYTKILFSCTLSELSNTSINKKKT